MLNIPPELSIAPKVIVPLTQATLQDSLIYAPDDGTFFNLHTNRPFTKKFRIKPIGIGVVPTSCHLAEIAFLIMTSERPYGKFKTGCWENVVYLDGDNTNFQWDNMRDASPPPDHGVYWSNRLERYRITILHNDKYKSLFYQTLEEAIHQLNTPYLEE